jgi:hypothetical protein
MVKRLVMVAVLLVVPLGVAFATHPGAANLYEVLGFTADGKFVLFKKTSISPPDESHWVAVYDVATAKSKTAQPVFRSCMGSCESGQEIDKKVGEKTIAELHKKYGAPTAASLLPKPKVDEAAAVKAVKSKAGYVQVFSAGGVEVRTTTKVIGGKLPELDDGEYRSVQFELEIAVTAGTTKWSVTQKPYADAVSNLDNGNIVEWPELHVQQVAVAPDRKSIALVFARKPYVIKPK